MNARDELASIIQHEYGNAVYGKRLSDCYTAPADAILAAGYRKPEPEPDWDSVAARDDLIRMLNESRDIPGSVGLPRFAVNMLLDKIAEAES